jgi:hypothetical protein
MTPRKMTVMENGGNGKWRQWKMTPMENGGIGK